MQGRLTVEQHNVAVLQMPVDSIADTQVVSDAAAVAEAQVFLVLIGFGQVSSARPLFRSVQDVVAQTFNVVGRHAFWVGEDFAGALGDSDLVDAKVGIRRDDGTRGKVDALSRQVSAESPVLALKALAETFLDLWQVLAKAGTR